MGPNQAWELFHSKGKKKKKTIYRQGEKICKWYNQQGLNFQNYTNSSYNSVAKIGNNPI